MRAIFLLFSLIFGCCVGIVAAQTPKATPPAELSAEQYRAQLESALKKLRAMQNTRSRSLAPVMNGLAKDQIVRRDDGQTRAVNGDEWQRRALEATGNATRDQVIAARESVEARLAELKEWTRRHSSESFVAAEAQTRVNQLEGSGEIRTTPTAFEENWSRFKKSLRDAWEAFVDWLNSRTPRPAPGSAPQIDPALGRALLVLVIAALVGTVLYLLWRAFGNPFARLGQRSATRGDADADEALLQLPPDELLERARAFARAGDFREALRHVYIRLLLQFDVRGIWRYDARRTNWEHIELLRRHPSHAGLAVPLADLTQRFDRVRYGGASCDSADWIRFEKDALELESKV